ncbi:hypothetical protein [Simiduia agarivorans]|uniref:DUF5666 domain-containing protein n=1 Tax=Simiduia agarivorans (strain DSM 21679 / JCM 13881 / BCRC 17597 / SA1) TaxID=1117647 RepID=K4KIR2_SIMAS|nr:hypothetical protein [Simiduia agarivorans]AFU98916.1 hypothetical protein M5M_08635 [Simiduia agarivorans SA1 = DSM 21679]
MVKSIIRSMAFLGLVLPVLAFAELDEAEIDHVDESYKYVVIGDRVYSFALNAKFFDKKGRTVNRYALKQGMLVEFDFDRGPHETGTINRVTIVSDRE